MRDVKSDGDRSVDITPPLGLIAVFFTLIGREDRSVAPPALLCHKEPAQISKAPSKAKGFGMQDPTLLAGPFWPKG